MHFFGHFRSNILSSDYASESSGFRDQVADRAATSETLSISSTRINSSSKGSLSESSDSLSK